MSVIQLNIILDVDDAQKRASRDLGASNVKHPCLLHPQPLRMLNKPPTSLWLPLQKNGWVGDIIKQQRDISMSSPAQQHDQFIYQIQPSYKSQTAIRITRKIATKAPVALTRPAQENPYVYKPKSYSRKRNFQESSCGVYTPQVVCKKMRNGQAVQSTFNGENTLDGKFIALKLQETEGSFFSSSFREKQRMEEEGTFALPLKIELSHKARKNPQLANKIEIVSTDNSKLLISIHEGLLKANTNHSKQEQSLQGVANPFNATLKKHYSENIPFIREYKSGYTPIELQNRSKKDEQVDGGYEDSKKGTNKSHFIKKKQSTLSLPRTCGVSYIKPTESVQGFPYEPLPPLIFQCSTSCNYTNELRQLYQQNILELIHLSQSRWLPVILTNQEHMRDLLLGKPYGKVLWVHGIMNLWPLFNQGNFMLIFFQQEYAKTEEEVWKQFNTCHFKFGILTKKSTSGKKLFLKSIQPQSFDREDTISIKSMETLGDKMKNQQDELPLNEQVEEKRMEDSPVQERKQCKDVCQEFIKELKNCRTVITMSLKFQMYVHQLQWKSQHSQGKNLLNAIIHSFEEHLQKKAIEVIRDRLEIANPQQRQELISKAVSKIKIGNSVQHLPHAAVFQNVNTYLFNLNTLKSLISSLSTREHQASGTVLPISQIFRDKDGKESLPAWQKTIKMPIYYISTRDSFAFDMIEDITLLQRGDRTYKKIVYRFELDNIPQNFADYRKLFPDLQVGVTSYHDFFTEQQLQHFETRTLQTQKSAFKNKFLQMTVQPTIVGSRIKRTKFFFGYRYMWTRCQLAEPTSYVGAGVRKDVTAPPKWLKDVENPMVEHNILEPNFLNSIAINVYHDGTEGLAQHFDDAVRFKQPIYTLRLVSDGRLSFGSQFYGFCNGAFIIPLPRGCICRMEENSYAANGVKHCVRPCDMSGKSAAIILRQMHHQVVTEAARYDELIDFPAWLSTLSEDEKAITFAEQKRREAEQILADEESKKEKGKAVPVIADL